MIISKRAFYWIFLPFRIAVKFSIFIVFIVYIILGVISTVTLYSQNMAKAQDISALYKVIDDAVQNNKPLTVSAWMSARPLEETGQLIKIITPKSGELEATTFFEIYRRELRLGNFKEALFWLQLGRYRMRFDAVRCNTGPDGVKFFDRIMNFMPSKDIDKLLREHPEALKKALQRVLDFDAAYPAHNDPSTVCKAISTEPSADEKAWETYRQALRKITEDFIQTPGKEKKL